MGELENRIKAMTLAEIERRAATYTCPVCNEVYDVVAWEKILGPFYGLCPECYEEAHLERIRTIDHIAKGKPIKEKKS